MPSAEGRGWSKNVALQKNGRENTERDMQETFVAIAARYQNDLVQNATSL